MSKAIFFIVSLFIVLCYSCSNSKESCCIDQTDFSYKSSDSSTLSFFDIDTSSIEIVNYKNEFIINRRDLSFGFCFYQRENSYYVAYLNLKRDSLIFLNLFANEKPKKIPAANYFTKNDTYNTRIINDTLHIINNTTLQYFQLKIQNDFTLKEVLEFELRSKLKFKNQYLFSNYVYDKNLEFSNPFLIFTYGDLRRKNNAGESIFFKVDISTGKTEQLIDYPKKYRNCDFRNPYSHNEKIGPKHLATIFPKRNEILLFDISSATVEKRISEFPFQSYFMCYSHDMDRNLAAVVKYDLIDEENQNLIFNNNYLYLIKRLRRNDKNEPMKCAILLFDTSLNHLATYFPPQPVWGRISLPYKNGISILSDSVNKAYFYEFKKKNK